MFKLVSGICAAAALALALSAGAQAPAPDPKAESPKTAPMNAHHQHLAGRSRAPLHVADGWVARHLEQLSLAESEEMRVDRAYLEEVRARFAAKDIEADTVLLNGEPADQILKLADERGVDLIAMSTHWGPLG